MPRVHAVVNIGQMVLEEIFKCCQSIFAISLLSPLEKVCDPTVEQTWKDALCQVWLKLAQWLWRKRWKCENFTDRWLMDQKSSFMLSSGKLKSHFHCLWTFQILQREITLFIECTCTPIFHILIYSLCFKLILKAFNIYKKLSWNLSIYICRK